jgi:hypothetical protein
LETPRAAAIVATMLLEEAERTRPSWVLNETQSIEESSDG